MAAQDKKSKRSDRQGGRARTHGRYAYQRRADTGVKASPQPILGDASPDDVQRTRVDAPLSRLQADLYQVEGVADDNGAKASKATSGERPQL